MHFRQLHFVGGIQHLASYHPTSYELFPQKMAVGSWKSEQPFKLYLIKDRCQAVRDAKRTLHPALFNVEQ
jgi:hypothetical protein